jgi:uncharacterized protein (DUF1697 family)
MTTYVALFCGLNVGGRNRLPMKALVSLLERLGAEEVRTYIQSGNAVFRHPERRAERLAPRIEAAVAEACGGASKVLLRGAAVLDRAIEGNPYPDAKGDPKSLHVYFLDAAPRGPNLAELERLRKGAERFLLAGDLFYLHAPEGIGRSKLAARVAAALGVVATARNWRTVCELRALVG